MIPRLDRYVSYAAPECDIIWQGDKSGEIPDPNYPISF